MKMSRYETYEVDNRDAAQMYEYLEARIEFMKRRIIELEKENHTLRQEGQSLGLHGIARICIMRGGCNMDDREKNQIPQPFREKCISQQKRKCISRRKGWNRSSYAAS